MAPRCNVSCFRWPKLFRNIFFFFFCGGLLMEKCFELSMISHRINIPKSSLKYQWTERMKLTYRVYWLSFKCKFINFRFQYSTAFSFSWQCLHLNSNKFHKFFFFLFRKYKLTYLWVVITVVFHEHSYMRKKVKHLHETNLSTYTHTKYSNRQPWN